MRITVGQLKKLISEQVKNSTIKEADDVFGTLGNALNPNAPTGEPKIVSDARMIVSDKSKDGKLTDPVTGKRYKSDFGTANMICQLYDSDAVTPELKEKLFTKLQITKLVSILWKNAEFKR
jgi:hypothetical protein